MELFSATTVIDRNWNILVKLSMSSELILEEPLSVASVITFGIGGDCIVDELIVNASIDDIYGKYFIIANVKLITTVSVNFLLVMYWLAKS